MSFITELSERMPQRVHAPGSPAYETGSHVFAGQGTPDAVVRPSSAAEVAEAVRAAVAAGVPITVRSGGHGSDPATAGLLLDLSDLAAVELAGTDGLVHVGAGAKWGEVAAALAPHGLGITSGDTVDVGVGGLALGGGIGWLARTHGLTVDLLREVELVTAAGDVLTVNAESHPDLFWALRGGGGNFGVATRFTFQAAPVDGLVGGHLRWDQSDVPAVLRAWRDVLREAPDELNGTLLVMPPLMPEIPAGPQLAVALLGTEAELRRILAPMLELPSLADESLGPVAYVDLLEAAPPGKPPFLMVGGNGFVPDLSDEALEAFARAVDREVPTMLLLRALGGAFSRVAADATAIAQRDGQALLAVNGILPAESTEEQIAAARVAVDEAIAFTTGRYSNFTPEFDADAIAAIYPPATLERLRAVKREVDPGDVFRASHHIAP
ncbi:FAD-binding oxidoreductase [Agromyces aurantiacus]|uniref:FAD-binding oxidoreductase n=1 Tax=Agromyces aurantiacus TaxID=165814 RepID=A0ABV9R2K5_9MICO|nr:FAD-binding protein [Agromyces aurantiacus]MBM7503010.1 FAD/FMN-containing dehydrogenase [Agromyces aurantiacus]